MIRGLNVAPQSVWVVVGLIAVVAVTIGYKKKLPWGQCKFGGEDGSWAQYWWRLTVGVPALLLFLHIQGKARWTVFDSFTWLFIVAYYTYATVSLSYFYSKDKTMPCWYSWVISSIAVIFATCWYIYGGGKI